MKKNIYYYILLAFLSSFSLHADIDDDIYGGESIDDYDIDVGPVRIELSGDAVSQAHIKNAALHNETVEFSQVGALVNFAFCYLPQYPEVYSLAIGYIHTNLSWCENPYFKQNNFDNVAVALRFWSMRVKNWTWQGQFAVNFDVQHTNLNYYMNYDLTFWGRYSCRDDLGFHLGLTTQTGMKIDHLYPIVGFDWDFRPCWTLNAIFPVNISLLYEPYKNWSTGVGMRFFDIRNRVGADEPLSMALFNYRNSGVELTATYECEPKMKFNAHAGYTLGGDLRISDKDNQNPVYIKQESAPYFGAEIMYNF